MLSLFSLTVITSIASFVVLCMGPLIIVPFTQIQARTGNCLLFLTVQWFGIHFNYYTHSDVCYFVWYTPIISCIIFGLAFFVLFIFHAVKLKRSPRPHRVFERKFGLIAAAVLFLTLVLALTISVGIHSTCGSLVMDSIQCSTGQTLLAIRECILALLANAHFSKSFRLSYLDLDLDYRCECFMDTYGWKSPGETQYEIIPHVYSYLQAAQAGAWISVLGWTVIFVIFLIKGWE